MPNHDDRRYNAESARRTIHQIANKPHNDDRDLDRMYKLATIADTMERQNNNEEMRRGVPGTDPRYEMGGAEMREYRENPGRYNPQDRPRNNYEDTEMRHRRSSKTGRYMENDGLEEMIMPWYVPLMESNPYPRNEMDRRGYASHYQYPNHMPPYMTQSGQEQKKHKIGFAKTTENDQNPMQEDLEEMGEYISNWLKHEKIFEKTGDQEHKKHSEMEFEEFIPYFKDFIMKISQKAKDPQKKQKLNQALQQAMQQIR